MCDVRKKNSEANNKQLVKRLSKEIENIFRSKNYSKVKTIQAIIKIRVIDQTVSLGLRMSECLEGFVSAVKALFPISTQTYHQEGKPKEYTLCITFSSPYFLLRIRE